MAVNLGRAVLYLTGDDKGLTGVLGGIGGKIQGALGGVGGFMANALSFATGGLIEQGIGGITSAIGGLASSMVSGNAEFETYETQFGVLLGSADAAKQRLGELSQFAAKTPFELPEVVRADKILTAFGLDSETTAQKFGVSAAQIRTTVGDVASGVGVGFEEMAGLMGRFSSGATGEAIARFQELGVTTKEEMASWGIQFSKSGEMLTPTKEAFSILESHLRTKFGGMMDAQSKTFNGMLSNLEDWKGQTLRKLGAPIFEVLKDKLGTVLEFLNKPETMAAIDAFANAIATGIGKAIDWLTTTGIPLFQQGIKIVGDVINAVKPFIDGLIGAFTSVGDSTTQTGNWLQTTWQTISGIFQSLLPPILTIVTTVFGAIAGFLQSHGAEIQGFVQSAWMQIQNIITLALALINATIVPVFQAIAGFISENGATIQAVIDAVWNVIKGIIQTALDAITGILQVALAIFKGDWQGAGEALKTMATNIWGDIKGIIDGLLQAIGSILTLALAAFGTTWETAWNGIKTFIEGLPASFATAAAAVAQAVVDAVMDLIGRDGDSGLRGLVSGAWNGILDFIKGLPGGFLAAAQAVGTAIKDGLIGGISGALQGVQSLYDGLLAALKGVINSAIDAVNNAIPNDITITLPGGAQIVIDLPDNPLPHLARGTRNWPGGWAVVADAWGPELALLPGRSMVFPPEVTQRLLGGRGGDTYYVDARGATLSRDAIRAEFRRALEEAGRAADARVRAR